MFKFFKRSFMSSLPQNASLNNEPCLAKPNLSDLNPNKLHYYTFIVSLDRCNGSCNTLDDSFRRIYVPNLNAFNMITRINESKTLTKHFSYYCNCKFDGRKCNLTEKLNNDKYRCEWKNSTKDHLCKEDDV